MSGVAVALPPSSIGVMTDLHGNTVALRSVIADAERRGVDRWLVLGDVVAMGPDPSGVLEMLQALEILAVVGGNTERYVLTGDRPDPTFEQVIADPDELPRLVEVAATFAWTRGHLSSSGHLAQLSSWVPSVRFVLPDETRVLAVHASLVSDDGRGVAPDLDATTVARLFPDHQADLILAGHTHKHADLRIDGARFVNPGSVSNHDESHAPAQYSIVRVGRDTHQVEHHDVAYDKAEAVAAIKESGIPGAGFLLTRYFGLDPGNGS